MKERVQRFLANMGVVPDYQGMIRKYLQELDLLIADENGVISDRHSSVNEMLAARTVHNTYVATKHLFGSVFYEAVEYDMENRKREHTDDPTVIATVSPIKEFRRKI